MYIDVNLICIILFANTVEYAYFVDGYLGGIRVTYKELSVFESEIPMPNVTASRPGFNITYPLKSLTVYTPILAHGYHVPKTVYQSSEGRFFFGHFNLVNSSYTYQNKNITLERNEIVVGWLTFSRPYNNITIYVCKSYIAKQMQ